MKNKNAALVNVKSIREKSLPVMFVWNRKKKGNTQSVENLRVVYLPDELEALEKTTKAKVELLMVNLSRAVQFNKVRNEVEMEVFINSFVDTYNPHITFNESKLFNQSNIKDSSAGEMVKDYKNMGFVEFNKKSIKSRYKTQMKKYIKNS